MNDAALVSRLERVGDLPRDRERFIDRNRPVRDAIGKRRPFDQLHDQEWPGLALFEAVNVRDVWMVQRREDLRFATEPGQAIGVGGDRGRAGS